MKEMIFVAVRSQKQKTGGGGAFACRLKFSYFVGSRLKVSIFGCVRLGNLDLDFKIRISDLQSNAKSENGLQR